MNERVRIFFNSFILYAVTGVVALTAAWQHVIHPALGGIGPLEMTLQNGLIFLAVFIVFTVVMVRYIRVAHVSLSFLLLIALVAGAQFVFSAWLPRPWDIVTALGLVVLLWRLPLVIVHDVAIVVGIGGIVGVLGLSVTPLVACSLLAALSLYDIISVYRTHHMVALADRMMESGAVFGFLVPASSRGFIMRRDTALGARAVMMLGSGDIGLPLVLATSAVSQSIGAAILVALCSLLGISVMHWLFAHQERPAPMAALPPIAVSAIIGYVLAVLLRI
jgi:presenilin-like A22 family membrane protease